ncbi:hypothetical protein JD844_025429 [Phrynosoma platyrhinos]|uniref:Uncharacterized protein n=1 Tax=Phrynosoma platyrhinos TaxID=52577 RepID=A0ABQ7SZH8_PHRPL|nr:hypothetical protein JD844_025429 [Phrynosoma platyrhinos]
MNGRERSPSTHSSAAIPTGNNSPFICKLLSPSLSRWLPESARWLLTKKEVETAHSYLSTCAKVNGKQDFSSKITPEVLRKSVSIEESRTYFYWHLFKTPKLRKITLCSTFVWFGVSFTYYGISLNIGGFSLDPYLTQLIFGAIEIPAKLEHGHVRSAVAILGKGFSEAAFTTVFLYTAELYPTVLRNKNFLGTQVYEQSVVADGGSIGLGLLSPMSADAPLPKQEEASHDCDKEAASS